MVKIWLLFLALNCGLIAAATAPRLDRLPLYFEENRGQLDTGVDFVGRSGGEAFLFNRDGDVRTPAGVKIRLRRSSAKATWFGVNRLAGESNYFLGSDPRKWLTGIPQYARVVRKNAYPGIDVVFYGGGGKQVEYDFVVTPGADPGRIEILFEGAGEITMNSQGDLVARGLVQKAPRAYQEIGRSRIEIAAKYRFKNGATRIELGWYDKRQRLVIDPVVVWAAKVGAANTDGSFTNVGAFTADAAGNVYLTGTTSSSQLPLVNAYQSSPPDAGLTGFVIKLDTTGQSVMYATYLGGSRGSQPVAIAVDLLGQAYVIGDTTSSDFPLVNPVVTDSSAFIYGLTGFMAKFSASGSALEFSTYIRDVFSISPTLGAIVLDKSNDAFVKGSQTLSKFSPDNSLAWSSPVVASVLAVDPDGNPVGASTVCDQKPLNNPGAYQTAPAGGCDVLIEKWSGDGIGLLAATLFGGEGNESASRIAVSDGGSIYVTGNTTSHLLPVVQGAVQPNLKGWSNGFLAVFNGDLSQLTGMTYLGGGAAESIGGLSVTASGDAYISGQTVSADFPQVNPLPIATSLTTVLPTSSDGGVTWTSYANSPPLWTIHSLVVSNPVWLALGNDDQTTALYRSTDRGLTWTRVTLSRSAPSFYHRLVQSPVDPMRIYAYDALVYQTFYISTDGGLTWGQIGDYPQAPLFRAGFLMPHPSISTTIFGVGIGITYSNDNNALFWRYLPIPGNSNRYYGLTVDPANPSGFVACGDRGIFRSTDLGATWTQVSAKACDGLAGTNTIPQILFAHTFDPDAGLMRSSDGGLTWSDLPFDHPVAQIVAAPDGSVVYVSAGATLYRSLDSGTTWSSNWIPFSVLSFYGAGLVMDPANSATLYEDYAGQSANFLTSISADTTTFNFSTSLGAGYVGPLPGSPVAVSVDASGNAIMSPPGVAIAPSAGSVNQGYSTVVKISSAR